MVKIPAKLLKISSDLLRWPESWAGVPEDRALGEKILGNLVPFLQWIENQGYEKTTTKRHFDNIWSLGGQLIRDLQWEDKPLDLDIEAVIKDAVNQDGGPLLHGSYLDEEEQRKFDATCRKLHKFLEQKN